MGLVIKWLTKHYSNSGEGAYHLLYEGRQKQSLRLQAWDKEICLWSDLHTTSLTVWLMERSGVVNNHFMCLLMHVNKHMLILFIAVVSVAPSLLEWWYLKSAVMQILASRRQTLYLQCDCKINVLCIDELYQPQYHKIFSFPIIG